MNKVVSSEKHSVATTFSRDVENKNWLQLPASELMIRTDGALGLSSSSSPIGGHGSLSVLIGTDCGHNSHRDLSMTTIVNVASEELELQKSLMPLLLYIITVFKTSRRGDYMKSLIDLRFISFSFDVA